MVRCRASRSFHRIGALAVVSLLGQGIVAGQQPAVPVLRASVDQVVVDVVVTDEHGGVVPGLSAADFEILEKGKLQTIGTFSEVFLPLVRPTGVVAAPPVATDVRTNQRRPEGRIYVIVLDDFHVGLGHTADVRRAAKDFLGRQVQPGDLVAVVTTTGVGGAFQDFTEDTGLAMSAVDRFVGRKPGENATLQLAAESASTARAAASNANATQLAAAQGSGADTSVSSAVAASAESAFGARNADPMAVRRDSTALIADGAVGENDDAGNEAIERTRGSLRTLRSIAQGLAGVTGRRKAVLYFGEGLPVTPRAKDLVTELEGVLGAAARANVTLYTFSPRGLDLHMGAELMATGVSPSAQLQQGQRLAADTLRTLAESTGGTAALETNTLGPALERVASESSHYYLIGYAPTDAKHDGRYRPIEVRVTRPGLRVVARKGYVAPDDAARPAEGFGGLTPELAELVRRPMSTLGLPLAVVAAPLTGQFDNVSVTVEVGPGAIPFDTRDGQEVNTVDVVIMPVGIGGKVYPMVKGHVTLALPAADAEAVRARGLRTVERVTLPPGTYQLHVAARESSRGGVGSVICDLVVPNLSTPGLTMTPIILSTAKARRVPSANRDDQLMRALGGSPPTAARIFQRDETITAYAEVVDVGATAIRDVELVTIVKDARDREVVHSARPNAAQRVEAGHSFPYAVDIPLRALPPGRYTLRAEARATGALAPAARELHFEIAGPPPPISQ